MTKQQNSKRKSIGGIKIPLRLVLLIALAISTASLIFEPIADWGWILGLAAIAIGIVSWLKMHDEQPEADLSEAEERIVHIFLGAALVVILTALSDFYVYPDNSRLYILGVPRKLTVDGRSLGVQFGQRREIIVSGFSDEHKVYLELQDGRSFSKTVPSGIIMINASITAKAGFREVNYAVESLQSSHPWQRSQSVRKPKELRASGPGIYPVTGYLREVIYDFETDPPKNIKGSQLTLSQLKLFYHGIP